MMQQAVADYHIVGALGQRTVRKKSKLQVHPIDHTMGWELFGRRALQAAHWKILWQEKPYGEGDWELYDLRSDPAEATDLSEVNPGRIRELAGLWEQYAKENGVVLPEFPEEDIEAWDSY